MSTRTHEPVDLGPDNRCRHCGSDRLDLERIDLATWMVPCLACKGWTRYRFATDTPLGNLNDRGVRLATGQAQRRKGWETFLAAARDYRVWLLFITYGACFGVELTIHNLAAVYYVDRFAEAQVEMFGWVAEGRVKHRVHVVDGLESAVSALNLLFSGENTGKVIVRV